MANVKIKLNSAGIEGLLKSESMNKLISAEANKIEKEMQTAIWVNREQNRKKKYPETNNKVYRDEDTPHDRRVIHVGVQNPSIGDFVFNTIGKAIQRAGGILVKKR